MERKAVYRFHALVADKWRNDRVFIAGDAAHQMPPFAGQGMCSGIRDAAALAWRFPLAAVSRDPQRLFDSYQAEREPHVRAITGAAIETGRVVCTLDPQMAAGRDAQMLAAKAAGAPLPDISSPPIQVSFGVPESARAGERFIQPISADGALWMDDVLGPGAWLIARRGEADRALMTTLGIRSAALDDEVMTPFRGAIAAWLDAAQADAVLVRADRYVFGTDGAVDLVAAFASQTSV